LPDQSRHLDCCAVILAGGLNTRMNGRNKAFLQIGGRTILDRLMESLRSAFPEILIVTRQPELYDGQDLRVVEDIYPARSSLTGIHAGLMSAKAEFAFVVPCDTPFLQQGIIRLLLDELEPDLDVVVPFYGGHYQPLCAVYSRRCIPAIEERLNLNDYKIINLFEKMHVKIVVEEKIKAADPNLLSFLNVNTPEAFEVCLDLAAAISNKKE
jgi:molybdopterin-guanine dinucleotide biosynthesis protein A